MMTSFDGVPSPVPGELWLAYVHFIDKPDVGKVRLAAEVRVAR